MRVRRVLSLATALGLLAAGMSVTATPSLSATKAAVRPVPTDAPSAERALRAASDRPVRIRHDAAGLARSVSAAVGSPVEAPATLADKPAPATAARAHLARYGALFGVRDQARELRGTDVSPVGRDRSAVRFQQTVGGIPVIGGELVTVVDDDGDLLSVTGETARDTTATAVFHVSSAAARATAIRTAARAQKLPASALTAGVAQRWMYDPSLLTPGAPATTHPVWRVEVTAAGHPDVRELVLVDAASGWVSLHYNQTAHVLNQVVCDNANRPNDDYDCRNGRYRRTQTSATYSVPEVNQAFDNTTATSNWYRDMLGVDLTSLIGSDFGDGKKLRSTVRFCPVDELCPWENAFWDGQQMVYGTGFAKADDVVAHELTHGVTEHSPSALAYWYQSGAINESMSDVFGELVDLAHVTSSDTAGVRWKMGEDSDEGPGRDMQDPPNAAWPQPDRMTSGLYDKGLDFDDPDFDNGGVHQNSGIGNKAAYLIVDGTAGEPGGAFNGHSFTGIGATKAAHLYWAAQQLLTPGSDYLDLATTLKQACTAMIGTFGFASPDCASVGEAVAATEMESLVPTVRVPGPPTNFVARGSEGVVELSWGRPAFNQSYRTSYLLTVKPALIIGGEFYVDRTVIGGFLDGARPGQTYAFTLRSVSASGTSVPETRTLRGTSVTLATPSAVTYGSAARMTGTLTQRSPTQPLAGRTVLLLRRYVGSSTVVQVASVRTASNGAFAFTYSPGHQAVFFSAFPSELTTHMGVSSARHTVDVRQKVSLALSDRDVRVRTPVTFRGGVTPARPGGTVSLQRWDGGWQTVTTGRLSSTGRYSITYAPRSTRDQDWRVLVPAWSAKHLAAGGSLARRLVVR